MVVWAMAVRCCPVVSGFTDGAVGMGCGTRRNKCGHRGVTYGGQQYKFTKASAETARS